MVSIILQLLIFRRRKGHKKESIDESESEDKEEDDTTNVLSENDIRLRSKRIKEDNSDSWFLWWHSSLHLSSILQSFLCDTSVQRKFCDS